MNDRRGFLKTAALTTSVLALGRVGKVFASGNSFAGVVYSKKQPGQWAKKWGVTLRKYLLIQAR